jgi:predicted RNA-binding Zn-ribbon protein involved in translation (DUF1610 family)
MTGDDATAPEVGQTREPPEHVTLTTEGDTATLQVADDLTLEDIGRLVSCLRDAANQIKYRRHQRRRREMAFECGACGWRGDLTQTTTAAVGNPAEDQRIADGPEAPAAAVPHLSSTAVVATCPECGGRKNAVAGGDN